MSGPDAIKGFNYQNAYTLYRLMELLDENSGVEQIAVEGTGPDIEDLTTLYSDGSEEIIQVKKRETRLDTPGLWGVSGIKSIIQKFYAVHLTEQDRTFRAYRFVATGSAHPHVLEIQQACERIRREGFSEENDQTAVRKIQEMLVSEKRNDEDAAQMPTGEQCIEFMRLLYLDIHESKKEDFEAHVQLALTEFVQRGKAQQAYNDLFVKVLNLGEEKQAVKRSIDRAMMLDWKTRWAVSQVEFEELQHRLEELKNILASQQAIAPASCFHGVPQLPPHFVGREDLLEEIKARLLSGESLSLSAEGKPGVGKTTLAVALARDPDVLQHFRDGVLWAGLGKHPDALSVLGSWADALRMDLSHLSEAEERAEALSNTIGQRRMLLVIDDAWELKTAALLKVGGPECCHLLTTRNQEIAKRFAGAGRTQSVPVLEEDPSFDLLRELAPEACAADPDEARRLAVSLGGLPLVLELVGGYLAKPERSYFPELSEKAFTEMTDPGKRLALAGSRLGTRVGTEVTLNETIALSLEDLPEEARQAFHALGAFAPKPASFSLEAALAVLDATVETMALLLARNLVEKEGERLSLHQVLAEAALAGGKGEEAQVRHRDYYLAAVNEDRDDWQRIARAYEQIKWVWERLTEDEVLMDYIWALTVYQDRRGLRVDQLAWFERGLAHARELDRKEDIAKLLNNIGVVYRAIGQSDKALEYYQQVLPIREEAGDRAGQATALDNIGVVYQGIGQPDKALEYFEQALPIREEVGDRAGVSTTLNNIGVVYDSQGRRDKALKYYEQALPIREEVGDRAGVSTTLNNIGVVYDSQGRRDKALEYFEQALPITEEVGDRAGQAGTLSNIGAVCVNLGQLDKALEYYEQALPIQEEVGDRAGQATTLNNIGEMHRAIGQRDKALEYYEQALPIREEVGDRAGQAVTLSNIGLVYDNLGQWEKAQGYYEQALAICEEVGDRAGQAVTRYNMAKIFRAQGWLAEAIAELQQVVELDKLIQYPNLESDQALLAEVEAELGAQQKKSKGD